MSTGPKPKRLKKITEWFQRTEAASSIPNPFSNPSTSTDSPNIDISEPQNLDDPPPFSESPDRVNALQRDPGLRPAIWRYPVNEQESVRKSYIALGPFQPELEFPLSENGGQLRRFQYSWFKDNSWLEYSIALDRAYCFPCFLFDTKDSHNHAFTVEGFKNWKKLFASGNMLVKHVGGITSPHNAAMQKWDLLRNPRNQIETILESRSAKEVEDNRLRLKSSIMAIRYLANQGASFRGHDESSESLNQGSFKELIKKVAVMCKEVQRVVLGNAPKNAQYTSHLIQKELLNILGNKVRGKIRDEVGRSKYCILVDEAVDNSSKEQMALILRFVDSKGLIRERFFKIVSVPNTTSLTLKSEISKVLTMYNLQVSDMRGQGYDGASNMRGAFNGLQSLFLQECPYAYFVHCFAHSLQLTLTATAQGVPNICEFFSTLSYIVNFLDSSAKRHSTLKEVRKEEITDLVACGKLQTGSGANQVCTLQRAGATRWSSHSRSIKSLIELFSSVKTTLTEMCDNGSTELKCQSMVVLKTLRTFNFVFCLLLMNKVMRVTEILCQTLQRKSIDIVQSMNFVGHTKALLHDMREEGWNDFVCLVESFCEQHDIDMPDMSASYKDGTCRRCQQLNSVTFDHHYRIEVFNVVIDFQLSELNRRFSEEVSELLILSSTFDPFDNFRNFRSEDVYKLAKKFYPEDFDDGELCALESQCAYFQRDVHSDPIFRSVESISDVCRILAQTRKCECIPMLYRLICLVLTIPVSTATTERAFSAMNIIKDKLRSKMGDEFLDDCMILHIEKEYANSVTNEEVIREFETSSTHRVRFSYMTLSYCITYVIDKEDSLCPLNLS